LAVWLWTILFKAPHARAYNLGSDEDISIKGLADAVAMASGRGLPLKLALSPQSGCSLLRYVPSIKRASEELGLRVRINLLEGINKTFIWNK
jgi:dTDP-glucose 4,6-dehydratase